MRGVMLAGVLLAVGAGCSGTSGGPNMPEFSEEFRDDYYKIGFLEDGYPGRRQEGGVRPHPRYGAYVLDDYLGQYRDKPGEELESAIKTVAHAAVDRMSEHQGALVFWYEPAPERGARLYKRHYSGLTQAHYAVVLQRAGEVLGDEALVQAADRVFDSLLVPVEEGGVYNESARGPVIAEVPQEPNSWILNGWQSALVNMHKYGELVDSERVRKLVRESAETMAKVLPLYDAPEVANSRYGLSGFTYMRLNLLGSRESARVEDVELEVPGEGSFEVPADEGTRWENHLLTDDLDESNGITSGSVRMNAVVSRGSYPDNNRLHFTLETEAPVDVLVEAYVGRYDPLASGPVGKEWKEVAQVTVSSGEEVTVDVPKDVVDQSVAPTNFAKEIEGKPTNVYHPLHVTRLQKLADITGKSELRVWAERWKGYICEWSKMELYEGLYVLDHFSDGAVRKPGALC